MGKKIFMYLLIFSCIFVIPATGVLASSDVIENNNSGIPDKNLYKTILKKLGKKSNEKFTKQEAAGIKTLDASYMRVKSLKGMKYLKNLQRLYLESNNLKSLNGIQHLTNLKVLEISSNEIKNIKPLKKLKKLNSLSASENKIKRLNGIENLKKLKEVNLDRNNLESVK